MGRSNGSPFIVAGFSFSGGSRGVGRGFSRLRKGAIGVTKHVLTHEVVNGTDFINVDSSANEVRLCIHHSSINRSICTNFGG